jgi:hypothetical protein
VDLDTDVDEAVVLLLLATGIAKAELASAATTKANEACIFVKPNTATREEEAQGEVQGEAPTGSDWSKETTKGNAQRMCQKRM